MYVLIANPGSARARLFADAVRAESPSSRLTIIPWLSIARGEFDLAARLPHGCVLRIDSAGQDFEVERALLELGYHERCNQRGDGELIEPNAICALAEERGRILAPRQLHLGFLRALDRIEAALGTRHDIVAMTSPAAIRELFDKRVTSRLYEREGIPVPKRLDDVASVDELISRMRDAELSMVFVKVACASSASCLAIVQFSEDGLTAISTVETQGSTRYNTRKLKRYGGAAADALIGFLLGEGAIVEEHVPKTRIRTRAAERGGAGHPGPGDNFDMRVLVVAKTPAFVVGRASPHLITNLHLGGRRIAEEVLREHVDSTRWDAAMADAVKAAACHEALHVGVDMAFVARRDGHVVFEANAFGDHLNGVVKDGVGPHQFELRALARARRCTSPSDGARSSTPSPKNE